MVYFTGFLTFEWPTHKATPIDRGAVPAFEQFNQCYLSEGNDPPALEKILDTFTRYHNNKTTPEETECLRQLPDKMKLYAQQNKEELQKVAKVFGETRFMYTIVNRLILSLTPSPNPPTADERTMIIAWTRFCDTFSQQIPAPINQSLKNLNPLLQLHTKEEIQRQPYLKTIEELAFRFLSKPLPPPQTVKYPEQIEFINDFSTLFMKCYLLEPLCEDLFTQAAIDTIARQFKNYFTQLSDRLFQHDPRPVLPMEKLITINLLKTLNRFLELLNDTLNTEANILSPAFAQQFYRESRGTPQPYDRKQIYSDIQKKLNKLLSHVILQNGESAEDKILILLLTTAFTNLIKRLSSPEVVPFITEQLVDRGIPQFEETVTKKKVSDPQFEQAAGNELSAICENFFNLGSKSAKITVLTWGLNFVPGKIMGAFVHDKLHRLASRELLLLEPFRFVSTILFQKNEGNQLPVFRKHLNQSLQAKQAYCENTKKRLFDNLYPTIIGWIKMMSPSGAAFLKGDSSKTYCNTIGEKLWDISQNSDLILMLIDDILKGLEESITNGNET